MALFAGVNIRGGGAQRAHAVADYVHRSGADAVVLSEVWADRSAPLFEALASLGFMHSAVARVQDAPTVAIASRTPLAAPRNLLVGAAARYIEADRPELGLTIAGVYGPLKVERVHDRFWTAVLAKLGEQPPHRYVLLGDLNTGSALLDAPQRSFHCSKYFRQLSGSVLVDAWRERNGKDRMEPSYSGSVNGYRLDHALVSRDLKDRVMACSYDHSVRPSLTDHSPIMLRLH